MPANSPAFSGVPCAPAAGCAVVTRRRGHQPRDATATRTLPGATKAVSWSRHESDTVDLLQAAAPLLDQVDRGVAQEARATPPRRVLEHADRLARHDHLAQLVGERHDFRDGGAALETGAAALAATETLHELEPAGVGRV